jgi:hypothetical protein
LQILAPPCLGDTSIHYVATISRLWFRNQ